MVTVGHCVPRPLSIKVAQYAIELEEMLTKINIVRYWLKSKACYRRGEYSNAITAYEAFAELVEERTRDRAYFATLLLLNDQYDATLTDFENIASGKYYDKQLSAAEMQYVVEYAKMYVCGLKNDPGKSVHYYALKSLQVRRSLERLLPISENYIGPAR